MKAIHVILCLAALLTVSTVADAQNVKDMRRHVKRGNRLIHAGERDKAYEQYKKAYLVDSTNSLVCYNLATSMFEDEWKVMKPDTVRDKAMASLLQYAGHDMAESSPQRRSQAYHNLGVMHQAKAGQSGEQEKVQELQQAIEAYKQALRNNPHDDEARYNLVLCQRQLPKGGSGGSNNEQKQDEQKDEKQEQQQQEQQQQQQQEQQQQQQQEKQDMERIEQLLNAAEQREKQTRQKIDQRRPLQKHQNEKNW